MPTDASKPSEQLSAALHALNWSVRVLAHRLNINESTVRNWLNGRSRIPDNVLRWITDRAQRADAGPPLPEGWESPPADRD